jgi:hypothetical protein
MTEEIQEWLYGVEHSALAHRQHARSLFVSKSIPEEAAVS